MNISLSAKSYIKEVPMGAFIEKCVDAQRILGFCKGCDNYGALWSCPPFDFCETDYLASFSHIRLFGRKLTPDRSPAAENINADALNEYCKAILADAKHALLSELIDSESKERGAVALSAGSCDGCEVCARKNNLPCRRCDYMRRSPESLGIDVIMAARIYFDTEILWAHDGQLPEYFFLMGGLLIARH